MPSTTPVLKLYNTLTRAKEPFEPIDRSNVRMYVCGPTVYDHAHIGNARPLIVFDVLFRLLRHVYGAEHVTYVRNITDVDDKINARAVERGISIRELTEETNKVFQEDVKALGCLEPTVQPRATEYVTKRDAPIDMIRMVARLIESGHAYAADGHVLFSVPSMPDYGKLSRRPLDEMIAGARVDVAPYKRGDMDFVLWKPSKDSEPGWDSPWGRGRPGWHIECSAMSAAHLGETFDIHGGGIDLVFPHHENEIAQSRCAFGRDVMAKYWMHNGFLQVEGEKMSKSLGNFVTIRELLRSWHGQPWPGSVVRWNMLQTHYRQPIDWTEENLRRAENELSDLFELAREPDHGFEERSDSFLGHIEKTLMPSDAVVGALADDLNTPLAIAAWRERAKTAHKNRTDLERCLRDLMFLGVVGEKTRYLFEIGPLCWDFPNRWDRKAIDVGHNYMVARSNGDAFVKLMKENARNLDIEITDSGPHDVTLHYVGSEQAGPSIDDLIAARLAARAAKNWAESDRIRDELASLGIALKDNKDGTTTWEVKR